MRQHFHKIEIILQQLTFPSHNASPMDNIRTSSPAVLALADSIIESYNDHRERYSVDFLDSARREPMERRSYMLELVGCGLVIEHRYDFTAAPPRPSRSVTFRPADWLRLDHDDVGGSSGGPGEHKYPVSLPPPRPFPLHAGLDIDRASRRDVAAQDAGLCPVTFWHYGGGVLQPGQARVQVRRGLLGRSFAELMGRMDAWACAPAEVKKLPVWRLEGVLLSLVLFMHPRVARATAVVHDAGIRGVGAFVHEWGLPGETPVDALERLQTVVACLPTLP
ncbi:hypothetical protein RB595_003965 [Gaeumannomyces hyphopodioides]